MLKISNKIIVILVGFVFFGCAPSTWTSTIYSDNYDKQANTTTVTLSPYGVVKIPGKWLKTRESNVSGQHFFISQDKDSVTVAVAFMLWNRYEFSYNNPQVTPENFVKKFYEWDATYLQKKTNSELRIVKEDKEKNYIIWSLSHKNMSQDYFLYGLKGKIAHNFLVETNKWDEDTKIKFLEKLYTE